MGLNQKYIQLFLTVLFIIVYYFLRKGVFKLISNHSVNNNIDQTRGVYTKNFFNVLLFISLIILISATWEISFRGLSIYIASIFTLIGIAFFASWSVLSNITSSIILFFYYPYRIGSYVKIIDGDNSIIGKVIDVSLFAIMIETENKNIVSYPNNLAIQKPMMQYKEIEKDLEE